MHLCAGGGYTSPHIRQKMDGRGPKEINAQQRRESRLSGVFRTLEIERNAKKATLARRSTTSGAHKDTPHESPQEITFSQLRILHPGCYSFQLRIPKPRTFPFFSCDSYTQDFLSFSPFRIPTRRTFLSSPTSRMPPFFPVATPNIQDFSFFQLRTPTPYIFPFSSC